MSYVLYFTLYPDRLTGILGERVSYSHAAIFLGFPEPAYEVGYRRSQAKVMTRQTAEQSGGKSSVLPPNTEAVRADPRVSSPDLRTALVVYLKKTVGWLSLLLVSWRLVALGLSGLFVGRDRAFSAASESVGKIPGLRGTFARQAFYKSVLRSCGEQVHFGWQTVLSKRDAIIGDGVYLGRHCSIGLVKIGANAMLADGVQVLSGGKQHGFDPDDPRPYKDQPQSFSRVEIGQNAWIGTNAVVMADVGFSAVVAAAAVVTRPIPPRTVAMGIPAKTSRRLG